MFSEWCSRNLQKQITHRKSNSLTALKQITHGKSKPLTAKTTSLRAKSLINSECDILIVEVSLFGVTQFVFHWHSLRELLLISERAHIFWVISFPRINIVLTGFFWSLPMLYWTNNKGVRNQKFFGLKLPIKYKQTRLNWCHSRGKNMAWGVCIYKSYELPNHSSTLVLVHWPGPLSMLTACHVSKRKKYSSSLYNNERCQRRRCLESGLIVPSCVQAKHRSKIPSWPCFPSAEKKSPVQLCPDSSRGPWSSEHASRKFHLPWRGWNWIATRNFDLDLADVGSEWLDDSMFRKLIKLNKLYVALLN